MAPATRDDGGVENVEKRREGSIVKITMKDFITYDSVVCTPGESLNVVIGPNGTGKSTILMAIVLGLGGKPAHLGKQNTNIQDFIKSHRQEAQIEIELYRHQRNTRIRRTIMKDGKSIWQLNSRTVPLRDIEAETKALNIQIDNLCQVLAQDRVQDFAKLNKQELLEATQKAVGKEGMSDIHSTLKDLQKRQKLLETQLHNEKKKREVEQGHVERLKGAVDKLERRRGIEEEAEACRLKLKILKYKEKVDEVDRYKKMKKEGEEAVRAIERQIEPYRQQISQAEQTYNNTKNKQNGTDRKISLQSKAVKSSREKLENLRFDILNLEVESEKRKKMIANQVNQEEKVRQTISKLKNDIAGVQSIPAAELKAKARQLEQGIEHLAKQYTATERKKLQIDSDITELNYELQGITREINKLQDFKNIRMRQLQEVSSDAYQAACWVDRNRHRFKGNVYLPMIVELDVDPKYAKYAENMIGYNDLIAIVCESPEDMKIVVDCCRKQMQLRVNVLTADSNCSPAEPRIDFGRVKSQYPQFDGYLVDFVKGPNTLINFLCHRKNFHNVPVSLSDVEAPDFSLYYSGNLRKSCTKSRYRPDLIYVSDPIGQARFFKQLSSEVDENSLRQRDAEIRGRINQKSKESNSAETEMNDLKIQRNKKRDELRQLQKSQATVQTMQFQLGQKEKELVSLEKNRGDPKVVESEFLKKLKNATVKLLNAQESLYGHLKELDQCLKQSQLMEFEVRAARLLVDEAKRVCRAEQDSLEQAKLQVERVANELAELRTEARTILNAIKSKNHQKEPSQLWTENEALFSTLPNTTEGLETHIADQIAHAQMLGGGNDDLILAEFQAHVRQLAALNTSIAEKEAQSSFLIQDMENRENQWKEELNELVDAISSNFRRCFEEMKCAGDVQLYTGNSEHDYDNYGLRVMVKFRDSEELQELNAHTQSGGERAVSTAIYMLALQELTPAPFRLVDEINQGMDSKNERKVYDLLLHSTSRPGTPQYFLLTPKLLKDMKYNPGTTVLCVMNSACAPSHKAWDLDKFISLRRQMGSNNNHDDYAMDVEDGDDD